MTAARPTNADFAHSGNLFDPATSGQGFTVEVNPASSTLFLAWYTYVPSGVGAGAAGQRWYTGQGDYAAGARSITLPLYETTQGVFDAPPPAPKPVPVGSGTLTFLGCTGATMDYTFTGGSSTGRTGPSRWAASATRPRAVRKPTLPASPASRKLPLGVVRPRGALQLGV